jgi:hypothetical protein
MLFISCNKNDDDSPQDPDPISQLPPATMTGENTFGFLLNGEPINVTNTSNQVAIYQGGTLQFGGGLDNSDVELQINIFIEEPIQTNILYNLTNIPVHMARFIKRDSQENCYYDFEDTIQGNVIITNLDQVNYIVSGTFELSTDLMNCENINITNGRFDLQYIP